MEESPTIVLPKDELRRMALENKLEEYKERLEMKQTQNPYMHPELFVKINSRELYKHDILERLLKDGEVNTHEFSLELDNKYGFLEVRKYCVAAGVIDDYCKTGGQNVRGGTGLRVPESIKSL